MGELRKEFGRRIRQIRKARDWTQEEFGAIAGLDYKYLGAIERGEKNLTIDNIEKIAKGFGIDACQLFLFSLKDVMPEEEITEEKIQDLLDKCDDKAKKFILLIAQAAAQLRE